MFRPQNVKEKQVAIFEWLEGYTLRYRSRLGQLYGRHSRAETLLQAEPLFLDYHDEVLSSSFVRIFWYPRFLLFRITRDYDRLDYKCCLSCGWEQKDVFPSLWRESVVFFVLTKMLISAAVSMREPVWRKGYFSLITKRKTSEGERDKLKYYRNTFTLTHLCL